MIIVGTGAGGGTLARHLAPSGKRILLLERGDWLPREPENWLAHDVFVDNRYVSPDTWYDAHGKAFQPQVHYFVGGATKLYGAALYRLRSGGLRRAAPPRRDLARLADLLRRAGAVLHAAEQLYEVHGARGEDPTEPPASAPYPFPAVSHEPRIQQLSDDLAARGLPPVPRSVRRSGSTRRTCRTARCVRCTNCDGFPCLVHGKSDAEVLGVRPALEHPNVTLLTNAQAVQARDERRRHRGDGASSSSATARPSASPPTSSSLACGAANTAKLLLTSASDTHPNGLANGSDQVGRNYMFHNSQAVLALSREREPDGLPEDARPQRLLLRRATTSTSRSATSRWSASRRRAMFRGEKPRRDEARAGVVARAGGEARDRLLALDRGPAARREPGHGRPRRQASTLAYTATNDVPKERLYASWSRCSASST